MNQLEIIEFILTNLSINSNLHMGVGLKEKVLCCDKRMEKEEFPMERFVPHPVLLIIP